MPRALTSSFWACCSLDLFQRTVGSSKELHLAPEHRAQSSGVYFLTCSSLEGGSPGWYGYSTKSTGNKGLPSFYITNHTAQRSSSKPPHGPRWLLAFQPSCLNSRQQDRERGEEQGMHHSYEVCSEKSLPNISALIPLARF